MHSKPLSLIRLGSTKCVIIVQKGTNLDAKRENQQEGPKRSSPGQRRRNAARQLQQHQKRRN